MNQKTIDVDTSSAFVETFTLAPYCTGSLDGLTFAVKDNIDIAGYKTSFGSDAWRLHHNKAVHSALCIEQLLDDGATCIGKTVSDEFTYSLAGESHFFGTPLNPRSPKRIPGGSSSGSASAVACELTDFSIGTDSAGSIRVPASFCGVWGMRPTLHRISEAGVLPFMPSVSTVGAFSNDVKVLDNVMRTLLRSEAYEAQDIQNIYLLEDAFAVADTPVSAAIRKYIHRIAIEHGLTLTSVSVSDIVGVGVDLTTCNRDALRKLQSAEFVNTVGGWIETYSPVTGPDFKAAYSNVKTLDRKGLNEAMKLCEHIYASIVRYTGKHDVFVFPTTPTIAPLKGSLNHPEKITDFYDRTMAVTAFAGIGRLPEISVPAVTVNDAPVGLSLAARSYEDEFLLSVAKRLFARV